MSPDTQELEAFFKNIQKTSEIPEVPTPVLEDPADFNRFFEKLSSLDDLNWSESESQSAQMPSGKRIRKSKSPAFSAPEQKMRVLHNTRPAPKAKPARRTPAHQETWKGFDFETLADSRESRLAQRLKSFGKFIMLSVLLFVLGLGAGWMALSIPTRFDDSNSRVEAMIAKNDQSKGSPVVEELADETAGEQGKGGKIVTHQKDGLIITESDKASDPAPKTVEIAKSETPKSVPAKKAEAPRADPRSVSEVKSGTESGSRFSLQVGACNSSACVDSYRKILLTQVKFDQIHISEVKRSKGLVQRIRVEPLSRQEAQGLKGKLAQVDARFKDAYLVAIR